MSWNSELLTEQANTLTQTTSERDPRAYSWGLFSWGDAPPAIGGGTGCFQWFDSREELLAFLTDYSPALYMSFEQEEEWIGFRDRLRAIAESFEDEPLRSLATFNSVLKGLLQIDWIGGFEELCQGQDHPGIDLGGVPMNYSIGSPSAKKDDAFLFKSLGA